MSDYFRRTYRGTPRALSKVMVEVYPDLSYGLQAKLLRQRDVFVDGSRCDGSHIVPTGSEINLYCAPSMIHLEVVYDCPHLMAFYKPKGIASDGTYSFEGLVLYVYGDQLHLLHRLDTNTDGLLLFAKGATAYDLLSEAMRRHTIVKEYRALVWGSVGDTVKLSGYLVKDADLGRVRIMDAPTRDAVKVACMVRPIESRGQGTLVSITLEGGKTHQLRAQLAHAGHFILGDGKYGDDRINHRLGYLRQQLTAVSVTFHLPQDGLGLDGLVITLPDRLIQLG